jgi:hypothetical protein
MTKKTEKVETEKTIISTEDDFRDYLKPYIQKRDEARQRIINLQTGLSEYRKKLELAEKKFVTLLKDSEDVMASGEGTFSPDVLLVAKRERDGLQYLIAETENDSMFEARAALDQTEADLKIQFFLADELFNKDTQEKLQQKFDEIEAIWNPRVEAVDKIRRELGLQFASYEVLKLYAIPPVKLGQQLQILVRNLL